MGKRQNGITYTYSRSQIMLFRESVYKFLPYFDRNMTFYYLTQEMCGFSNLTLNTFRANRLTTKRLIQQTAK